MIAEAVRDSSIIDVIRRGRAVMTPAQEATLSEALRRAQDRVFIERLRAEQSAMQAQFQRELVPVFDQLGAHVSSVARELGGLVIEAKRNPTGPEVQRIDHIVSSSRLDVWMGSKVTPALKRQWKRVAERTAKLIKGHYNFLDVDPRAVGTKMLGEGGKRIGLIDVKADTKKALFDVLSKAHDDGIGVRKTGRLIGDMVPQGRFVNAGSAYRGELIARTETLHASRMGALEAYGQSNRVREVIAYDGESDEVCALRNGQTFTLDEAEMESNETHPGCVLAWGPITTT